MPDMSEKRLATPDQFKNIYQTTAFELMRLLRPRILFSGEAVYADAIPAGPIPEPFLWMGALTADEVREMDVEAAKVLQVERELHISYLGPETVTNDPRYVEFEVFRDPSSGIKQTDWRILRHTDTPGDIQTVHRIKPVDGLRKPASLLPPTNEEVESHLLEAALGTQISFAEAHAMQSIAHALSGLTTLREPWQLAK